MRLYNHMMSSSTNGKGLSLDEPVTEIKFMMKDESMPDRLPNEFARDYAVHSVLRATSTG